MWLYIGHNWNPWWQRQCQKCNQQFFVRLSAKQYFALTPKGRLNNGATMVTKVKCSHLMLISENISFRDHTDILKFGTMWPVIGWKERSEKYIFAIYTSSLWFYQNVTICGFFFQWMYDWNHFNAQLPWLHHSFCPFLNASTKYQLIKKKIISLPYRMHDEEYGFELNGTGGVI